MPNIIINNYCNQHCPYCFAQDMMAKDNNNTTLEEFKKIFGWLKNSNCHYIGLIGGEPTLSPYFADILKYLNEEKRNYPLKIVIFTNGTNIEPYLSLIDSSYSFLININAPEYIGEDNGQRTLKNIELLSKRNEIDITFGITLFPEIKNTDYILKLAQKYNRRAIRVSYAAPVDIDHIDKEEYYSIGKDIFYNFGLKCVEYGIKMYLDCNRIPQCYFKKMEWNFLQLITNNPNIKDYCSPVIDIDKDGNAISCFGGGRNVSPKNIFNFDDLKNLEHNFICTDINNKLLNNGTGRCQNCERYKTLQCQGGCLAFSTYKEKEQKK